MTIELSSYLAINILGSGQNNFVDLITQSIYNCSGNILNTRMTTLGDEFGVMLIVEGSWGAIAKIEAILPGLENKLGITIIIRRTTPKQRHKKTVPYLVHAITSDREGILNDLTQFFTNHNIKIEDLNANSYLANTGTRMVAMNINISITVNTHMPTLREKFMMYCDTINLDAGLEPIRD